jgi:hypothetical protein
MTGEAREGSRGHAEAEALPVNESVEPAEGLSFAGPIRNQADRVREAEPITDRVEFAAVGHQLSAFL